MINQTTLLEAIKNLNNIQERLRLFCTHGFVKEANDLVQDFLSNGNVFFVRPTGRNAVPSIPTLRCNIQTATRIYVVLNTRTLPEYKVDDHMQLCFELGWEQEALGWSQEQTNNLIHAALNKAWMRPVNQWNLGNAQGNAKVVYERLGKEDPLHRAIMSMYYQFLLRRKDFGTLYGQICWIPPFKERYTTKSRSDWTNCAVEWMLEVLHRLMGEDAFRKELLEWMHLCPEGQDPQHVYMVATDPVFRSCPDVIKIAVRNWLRSALPQWVQHNTDFDCDEVVAFKSLFRMTKFDSFHLQSCERWIGDELEYGHPKKMVQFMHHFGNAIGFCDTTETKEVDNVLHGIVCKKVEECLARNDFKVANGLLLYFGIEHEKKKEIEEIAEALNR